MTTKAEDIAAALADPFPAAEVSWKPQATKGERALAICYIDARNVMDRLDSVLGIENWQDAYSTLPDGNVVCTLSLRIGGEWIHKTDLGGPSDQHDGGDKEKAAFSDALKRAAVKWGIVRYLYKLEGVWVDYDVKRKQLASIPGLPAWALPRAVSKLVPASAKSDGKTASPSNPMTFVRFRDWMAANGAMWLKEGLVAPNEIATQVQIYGREEGFPEDQGQWQAEHITAAMAVIRALINRRKMEVARKKPAAVK